MPKPKHISPAEHEGRLRDHAAWLRTGRSLLASAALTWPKIQSVWDLMDAQGETLRKARERGGDAEMIRVARTLNVITLPVLTEHAGYGGCYLLLAGLGIENLLKAIRVKRLIIAGKAVRFGGDGTGDGLPKNHGHYVEMARSELGGLTDQEISFLDRVSIFVTWAGRYPVSIEPPTIEAWNRYVDRTDKSDVDRFSKRLVDKYESIG